MTVLEAYVVPEFPLQAVAALAVATGIAMLARRAYLRPSASC
jgi:hypothetical protein